MTRGNQPLTLASEQLAVSFDQQTGSLTALHNKLTGERYALAGDEFEITAVEFRLAQSQCRLQSFRAAKRTATARYHHDGLGVTVHYQLGTHFLEKRLVVVTDRGCGLRKLVLSSPEFAAGPFRLLVPYRYQGNITYFGRTPAGGFFAGVELPGDASALEGNQVTLAYRPGLKMKAGENLESEPAYFGVYRRQPAESDAPFSYRDGSVQCLPLPSESAAMVSLITALLEPVRPRPSTILVLGACGYSWQHWYTSRDQVEERKKCVDFAAECGMQYVQDAMPWGGHTAQISAVTARQDFTPHPWSLILPQYARRQGLTPLIWSTMTNTHPWKTWDSGPFRPDRPDWLVRHPTLLDFQQFEGNCLGCRDYVDWLIGFYLKCLAAGQFNGFSLDGDFHGGGGNGDRSLLPLRCLAENHDHLPGEGQYAALRGLRRLLAAIRAKYPTALFWLMRPVMDCGVWLLKNGGVMFPISENPDGEKITAIAGQPVNVEWGDMIRHWSRLRLHRHFVPPSFDQAKLFARQTESDTAGLSWPSEKLDYALLSAISSTPNQCFFNGPLERIPDADRQTIRHWLDWARANEKYLLVRKDLPAWPGQAAVDGSSHLVAGQGYVFLFNPHQEKRTGEFDLTEESLGLAAKGVYRIKRLYPAEDSSLAAESGDTIRCDLDGFAAAVFTIRPADGRPSTPGTGQRTIRKAKRINRWETSVLLPPVGRIADAPLPPAATAFASLQPDPAGYAVIWERARHRHGLIYVRAWVELPAAGDGRLLYVADGPVKVWVNGAVAGCQPAATNPASPKDKYAGACQWRQGRNEIVWALDTNQGRAWGVFARCEY